MLRDFERIAGKVANAPRPPLPGGVVEETAIEDSPDMLTPEKDGTYLPAGVILEYRDDHDQWSVRRVTLLSAKTEGDDPSFTAFCHTRQDIRRFRLTRPMRVIDPHGGALPYDSPYTFLERFRCEGTGDSVSDQTRSLLCAARDELSVLMFFSRCDGYLHPAERTVVLSFIQQNYGKTECPADTVWEIVRRLYPDSRTMLNCAHDIMDTKGEEALEALQQSIRTLIEADGIIHSDEALHAIELSFLR